MSDALDMLDSRALRLTDCYGQRFMKSGSYRYNVLPVGGDCVTGERPFTVQVTESTSEGKMKQHRVVVTFQAGRFGVERDEITIAAGDLVMWHCPERRAIPYLVSGEKEFFASNRLRNESGYSHAFGSPGEYQWMDPHGSGVRGIVRVKNPSCKDHGDFERWRKLLAKGTLITITDRKAEPNEVEIVTGQTIFFAITKGPGISITDVRLLGKGQGLRNVDPRAERPSARQRKK